MSAREAAKGLRVLTSPLARWRGDPRTDEIAINAPGEAWVRQDGRFKRYEVGLDYDDLIDIAVLAGALNQQNVSESSPLLAADLPDGSRLQAVLPPCVPPGTVSLTFRLHSPTVAPLADATKRYALDRWNQWERRKEARRGDYAELLAAFDTGDVVLFLHEAVRLRMNVIMTGATGSGKTTCLRSFLNSVQATDRIITIENALELVLPPGNHVRLLYSHGENSVANVSQGDLLAASLRMRPDRIVVGEIRDPEAAHTFVSEVTTGHLGSASTIHGKDASQGAVRLFNLFKASEAGRSYSDEMITRQLAMSVDCLIPFSQDGGKYAIGEVWFSADAERRGQGFGELLA